MRGMTDNLETLNNSAAIQALRRIQEAREPENVFERSRTQPALTGRLTSYPDGHFRPCELFWHPMDLQTSYSAWVPHLGVQDIYSRLWGVSASLLDRNILGSLSRSQTSYPAGPLQDSPREHISTASILATQRNGESQRGRLLLAEMDPGHLY